jgi:hypothetical protein
MGTRLRARSICACAAMLSQALGRLLALALSQSEQIGLGRHDPQRGSLAVQRSTTRSSQGPTLGTRSTTHLAVPLAAQTPGQLKIAVRLIDERTA